jgi:hypothetical protein
MHLWDILLPQAVITLNMLRKSRINPKLSAATHIYGQYYFNRAPMTPPGTRVIAHETPNRRRTWAKHGQDGWYIGPALEYCRCYTVYITKTRGERIVETVEFPPERRTSLVPYYTRNHSFETPCRNFQRHHTTKIKICTPPHQKDRKCCTSEGAKHSFTSKGGKHNCTENVSSAKHIITLYSKFSSQTKNTFQTRGNTTNTTCYGVTQCWTTT